MPVSFTRLMESLHREDASDDARFSLTISEDWMQGRTTYGGLSAALCLEGVQRSSPELPPLRSVQVAFVGPAGGPVSVETKILRQGKSMTFAEAKLFGEKGLAAQSVFAFGATRPSTFNFVDRPAPDLPAPEASRDSFERGSGPDFAQHFDVRLARGGLPASGCKETDHYLWVRHKDASAQNIVALLALADMPPPAVMPMFTEFAPISTINWMVNMLMDNPRTDDGWWLLQSRAENACDGYTSQDMTIWNARREPVATGRQCVAIFA